MASISYDNKISINYETNNYNISFDIKFGEGKDSLICENEKMRKEYTDDYPVEIFEFGSGENLQKGYRVVGNEGPIVVNLSNISVKNNNESNYKYALGFAIDNKEPQYYSESDTMPYNIERDGTLWTIPANDYQSYKFDQNPKAEYQWVVKRALDKDYEPTEEEKELGMEKTSDTTGLFYITFMVYKKEIYEEPTRGITRGITRGATRGATRGGIESDAGRFGYGNSASSSSVKSEYKFAINTEKYILPIRTRIRKESEKKLFNCSETIRGASLNKLKQQTVAVPF